MEKMSIGVGHVVRALQLAGFGHEEIMALREAMLSDDFNDISFADDCYSSDWDDSRAKRTEQNQHLTPKTHPTVLQMACVGLENFRMTLWDPYDDIDPYTPALIPALHSDTLTVEGRKEWDDILSARVVHMHGLGAEGGNREPVLEIHGDASVQRVMDFGNLLADNCTQEQQELWVANPAVPANGYEWTRRWDSPSPGQEPELSMS